MLTRKTIMAVLWLGLATITFAQAPNAMKYQSVIRDANGGPLINQPVGFEAAVRQGTLSGPIVYLEATTLTTNDFGLVTRNIGETNLTAFGMIDWKLGPYYLEVGIDPTGGTNYTITGGSQILSVPYALHANEASRADSATYAINSSVANTVLNENDPIFGASVASGITSNDTAFWNGKLSMEIDGDTLNEIQQLSISNDTLHLSGGGEVHLPFAAVPNDSIKTRGALPVSASCPINGTYTSGTVFLQPGVYMYQLYSCPNQIGQAGPGFGVEATFVTGSGDATGTWHNFNFGECGVYYTGVVRVFSAADVGITYTSYGGSSFFINQTNAEGATFIRIH